MTDKEKVDKEGHFDRQGRARMVDVGDKQPTHRYACAAACVTMHPAALKKILQSGMTQDPDQDSVRDMGQDMGPDKSKGDVFAVARLAGIMAAKRTAVAIPLCHNLELSWVRIRFDHDTFPGKGGQSGQGRIDVRCACRSFSRTGVEMEALHGVTCAALTIYDMGKAFDRSMRIGDIQLLTKKGGRSGDYRAEWIRRQSPY